jgi:hypothetical protein
MRGLRCGVLIAGRRQAGRINGSVPMTPPANFFGVPLRFGSPLPLSRHKLIAHEVVKQRQDIFTSANRRLFREGRLDAPL